MGKRKRMIKRCAPALERSQDLRAEIPRYGVKNIYELPVSVLYHHRAVRLQAAGRCEA